MNSRELLIAARKLIVSKQKTYICIALWSMDSDSFYNKEIRAVQDMLGNFSCLEAWLIAKGHTTRSFLKTEMGKEKARQTRIAWIDWMLENHPLFKESA